MLLFSYKPVDNKLIWLPLRESFEELFYQTFSRKKNQTFLGHIQTCYRQKRWHDLLKLMQHIHKSAVNKETKNASGENSDQHRRTIAESRQVVVNYCSLVVFSVLTFTPLYYISFLLVLKNAALINSQAFKIVLEWSFFFSN